MIHPVYRHLEPHRHSQPAPDVPDRDRRGRDYRSRLRGLPLKGEQTMLRLANPAHPGQFIRMEIIHPLGLSVTAAAKVLGVTRPTLSALLNGRAALSSDMALRIEKAFG